MKVAVVLMICFSTSTALATPSRKEATAHVKEIEAAVKANKKVLDIGTPDVFRAHSRWYKTLKTKAEALFVDADACSFATDSAAALWHNHVMYSLNHDQLSYKLLQRHQEDYRDNMKACKESLAGFKQL